VSPQLNSRLFMVDLCTYCGNVADQMDHVPPRSHRHAIVMAGLSSRYPFIVVPSCQECNALLKDHPIWVVSERKAFVKRALRRKHAALLRIPRWSRDDTEELEGRLKQYVENSLTSREILRERLDW
jgi:hypothetical protein